MERRICRLLSHNEAAGSVVYVDLLTPPLVASMPVLHKDAMDLLVLVGALVPESEDDGSVLTEPVGICQVLHVGASTILSVPVDLAKRHPTEVEVLSEGRETLAKN